jgi:IstB-like ATP binding protein
VPGCIALAANADGRGILPEIELLNVLVIDDWAMAPLSEPERRDFWEICEDRYQARSIILTSQLPAACWHEQIGDPTSDDGILDRLVHNAHRIEMQVLGPSKRACFSSTPPRRIRTACSREPGGTWAPQRLRRVHGRRSGLHSTSISGSLASSGGYRARKYGQ